MSTVRALHDVQFTERQVLDPVLQRAVIQHIVTLHCGAKAPQPMLFALAEKTGNFIGRSCFGALTAAIPMALSKIYMYSMAGKAITDVGQKEIALGSAALGVFSAVITDSVADAGVQGFQFGTVATAGYILGNVQEGAILGNMARACAVTKALVEDNCFQASYLVRQKYQDWLQDPYCRLAENGPGFLACTKGKDSEETNPCPEGFQFFGGEVGFFCQKNAVGIAPEQNQNEGVEEKTVEEIALAPGNFEQVFELNQNEGEGVLEEKKVEEITLVTGHFVQVDEVEEITLVPDNSEQVNEVKEITL